MTSVRFALQALFVLALVVFVGSLDDRPLRAGAFWRDSTAASRANDADEHQMLVPGVRPQVGYGTASEFNIGTAAASALHQSLYLKQADGQRTAPAALRAFRGQINGIMGYATGSQHARLPHARLRLRNLSSGKIEALAIGDKEGRFAFIDVMPSSGYIVELLDRRGAVVGASESIAIGVGEVLETRVSRSGRIVRTSFSGGMVPSAEQTMKTAATSGVNKVAAPPVCASPPCDNLNP